MKHRLFAHVSHLKKRHNLHNSISSGDTLDTTNKFKFFEIKGDLFTSKDSLAHCVSADLKMGAGIAKEFRNLFKRVEELKRQHKKVGEVAVLRVRDRFIYYLITKEFYYKKPTLFTLKRSLEQMRDHAVEREIERIAMPTIGCGLDKLNWGDVKRTIHEVFKSTSIHITVYALPSKRRNKS